MLQENKTKPEQLDIQVEQTQPTKKARRVRVKVESVKEEVKTETPKESTKELPTYDLYKIYQEHFERQQTQVLSFWTQVLNNIFWWTKK